METLWQDVRYALRGFARRPGFTAAALLTLGVGIGATVGVFSVARAALFAPLPFPGGERMVRLFIVHPGSETHISLAPETFLEIRDRQQSFENLVAHRYSDLTLLGLDAPRRVVGMAVSEGWAETMGVTPLIGRTFTPEDDAAGGVVVLSHALWQDELGGDPSVLGRRLTLDGEDYAVIGVLTPGYRFPYDADLWYPMQLGSGRRATWGLNVQARLAPGVTPAQVDADLGRIASALAADLPNRHREARLIAVPARDELVEGHDRLLLLLLGAVGFVLVLVCANLANLLLARGVAREREMAIRAALGAGRGRQVRQLLTESLTLGALGGALGLGLAWLSSPALRALLPPRLQWVVGSVPIDGPVLGFALVTAVGCSVLFGLVPALRASRRDVERALRAGRRSGGAAGSRRLLDALAVFEVALALTLVSGATLMLRNLDRLQKRDLGYPAARLGIFTTSLDREPYTDPARRSRFVSDVEDRLRALPGVESAGTTCVYPLGRENFLAGIEVAGRETREGERFLVNHRLVTPGFLRTLGVRLLRGRLIEDTDVPGALPVVVVSEALARRYWPGEDPVGRRVRNQRAAGETPWLTVVGVVSDVREFDDVDETWYLPWAQHAEEAFAGQATFAVRSDVPLTPDLARRAVGGVDPTQAVYEVASVRAAYAETLEQERFGSTLLGTFAAFGLLLAGIGLYGVLSYLVSQQTHEIGIRMALGAGRGDVGLAVLRRGGRVVAAGLAIGAVLVVALSRLVAGLVSEIEPLDPVSLALGFGVLVLVGAQACWLPARRAMRSDPILALRED